MASCLPLSELSPISRQTDAASISFLLPLVAFWTTAHWVRGVIPKSFLYMTLFKCRFLNERSYTGNLLHQRIQPTVPPLPTRQFQTAINMKMGASAKVIGVMSYKRKWKDGRERVTAAGCSLTQLLTQLILFLPEMSNRSSYSRTTHVGLDGLPLECPRTCVISPIYAEGAKLLYAFDSSNTMLTKLQRMHLR